MSERMSAETAKCLLVLCACPDDSTATAIATDLLVRRLAACVNQFAGVKSVYWWDEQIRTDTEVLLVVKTTAEAYPALEAAILERHPYQVPEIIGLPVTAGSAPYLDWLRQVVAPA